MTDIFGPVEATSKKLYNDNVQLAVQQTDSRFTDCFTYIAGLKGKEMQAVELIGASKAIRGLPHSAPTPHIPPKHEGVNVRPERVSWGRTVPTQIAVTNVVDYNSIYVQEGAAAMIRERDAVLFEAIFKPRLIANDETGAVASVPWAGKTIAQNETGQGASGGNTGLTPGKVLKAIEYFINADLYIEGEDIYVGVAGQDNTSIMLQAVFTSSDYRSFRGSFDKRVMDTALGVKFVRYPSALTLNGASGYRELPVWLKSGMHWGEALPLTTQIERDPGRQYQLHPFMDMWIGATRSEDERVVKLLAV